MKMFVLVVGVLLGCNKKSETSSAPPAGSAAAAPAAPVEDVSCKDACKEYAKKMAATPGNPLSDAKDPGLISWTALSMEDYCDGEGGAVVPWTAQERACVKAAANTADAVLACFSGAALSQVNAGLNEIVSNALATKKANAATEGAGSAEKP
jgi:hypothetical protein